jgi:integrase
MASIERRERNGKTTFCVRYRDLDGSSRRKVFERERDATTWMHANQTAMDKGQWTDPRAGRVALKDWAETWLASFSGDVATRDALERRIRVHVLPTLGKVALRDLKPAAINRWAANLEGTVAEGTRRAIFEALSALLTAAMDEELIAANPCQARATRAPRGEVPILERHKVWTPERVSAVRSELPARYQAMADVGAGLGLRQGEIFGLAVEDIDFLRREVHVTRQVKRVNGRLFYGSPKTRKPRTVPLSEQVAFRLAAHLQAHPPVEVTLPMLPGGKLETRRLIFTTRQGGAMDRNYVSLKIWRPAVQRAGVVDGRENGMHALRRHYTTVLLEAGVNPKAVADWIGDDVGLMLRVYASWLPTTADTARAAVDAAFVAPTVAPAAAAAVAASALVTKLASP